MCYKASVGYQAALTILYSCITPGLLQQSAGVSPHSAFTELSLTHKRDYSDQLVLPHNP